MLFEPTEVNIEFVKRGQELAKRAILSELCKGIDILREALAAVAALSVGAWNVGVGVVDVTGEEAAGVNLRPIRSHFLAVLAHGVEIGDLVRAEDIMRILRDFRFKRRHHRELLRRENLDEKVNRPCENHRLLFEVLNVSALSEKLRHITDLVSRLARKQIGRARKNRRSDEYRHIRKLADKILHQSQVLSTVILRRDMDLEKSDIY